MKMNRINGIKTRSISVCTIVILSSSLVGCAHMPDNFQFTEEVVNREALPQIKRVALIDVPTPDGIWLGDPGSGVVAGLFGVAAAFATATREGDIITSSEKFSEVTRDEMRNWLEEAGIEVILLKAERVKKSKMLKNYDQFKKIDADAILEIAPIRVGFMEDLGEIHFTEGELSPDVALTYRLITPGDNEILIEANVFYSSFENQYSNWNGPNLLGPTEHIFEDSDSVKEHPAEAARRLKYAITGATEWISKVITSTRQSVSIVKPTGEIDVTGIYTSHVTSKDNADYWCFNSKRTFRIELKQESNSVKGRFLGGFSGEIEGVLVEDKVKFKWYSARCSKPNAGEWTVSSDGLNLEGYGWKGLEWKARKQY